MNSDLPLTAARRFGNRIYDLILSVPVHIKIAGLVLVPGRELGDQDDHDPDQGLDRRRAQGLGERHADEITQPKSERAGAGIGQSRSSGRTDPTEQPAAERAHATSRPVREPLYCPSAAFLGRPTLGMTSIREPISLASLR